MLLCLVLSPTVIAIFNQQMSESFPYRGFHLMHYDGNINIYLSTSIPMDYYFLHCYRVKIVTNVFLSIYSGSLVSTNQGGAGGGLKDQLKGHPMPAKFLVLKYHHHCHTHHHHHNHHHYNRHHLDRWTISAQGKVSQHPEVLKISFRVKRGYNQMFNTLVITSVDELNLTSIVFLPQKFFGLIGRLTFLW